MESSGFRDRDGSVSFVAQRAVVRNSGCNPEA